MDAVEVLDGETHPAKDVTPGQTITIALTVTAPRPILAPLLGFGIETSLGVSVYGTNTTLLGHPIPRIEGTARYLLTLNNLRLGEGSYTINGAIASESGVELHRLPEAARFSVSVQPAAA